MIFLEVNLRESIRFLPNKIIMKTIHSFRNFISESEMSISNPKDAGDKFAKILGDNKDIKESPKGSNKGPKVTAYLQSTGLPGGNPWCMAFVYYVFQELSKALGTANPLVKTAGVKSHWNRADKNLKIDIAKAKADPNLIKPGQIFIMSRPGAGLGHTGIVLRVDPASKTITTIEGNTNDQKSGEGDRVGINKRPLDGTPFLGFIDYFKSKRTPEFEKNIVKALNPSELEKISPLSTSKSSDFPEAGDTIPVGQEAIKKAWSDSGETPPDPKLDKFSQFLTKKFQNIF
jgi:hypothetical protein